MCCSERRTRSDTCALCRLRKYQKPPGGHGTLYSEREVPFPDFSCLTGKRRKDLCDRLILSLGLPNWIATKILLCRENEKQKASDSLKLTYATGRTWQRSHARPVITKRPYIGGGAIYINNGNTCVIFVGCVIKCNEKYACVLLSRESLQLVKEATQNWIK